MNWKNQAFGKAKRLNFHFNSRNTDFLYPCTNQFVRLNAYRKTFKNDKEIEIAGSKA
jgi:hypothetical protein